MNKFLHTFLLILSVTHLSLSAYDECDLCACPCFALEAELLYFKTPTDLSFADAVYNSTVTSGGANVKVRRVNNDPYYRPGLRIVAEWTPCCSIGTFQGRYAYLYNGHKVSASGLVQGIMFEGFFLGNILNFGPRPGTAVDRISTNYHEGELLWKMSLLNCCKAGLDFLFGVEGATIKYTENNELNYDPSTGPIVVKVEDHWRSRFWGIGPEIGFCSSFTLPRFHAFAIAADFRGALLAGKTAAKLQQFVTENNGAIDRATFTNKPSNWVAIPSFDGRLGLNFGWNCFCFHSNIEVGYEMLWYARAIAKIRVENGLGNTLDSYSNYCAHGPYLALRAAY